MSEVWAERQRDTNRLARRLAKYLFQQKNITAAQIYGLSKLAWITKGDEGVAYIKSTKIPALGYLFEEDFESKSLIEVAKLSAIKANDIDLEKLITYDSGFTNFYNAYRISVLGWIEKHLDKLVSLSKRIYDLQNESDRITVVEELAQFPGIPAANNPNRLMSASHFLTPLFFMLDPQIKFPIINGRKSVQNLLKKLNQSNSGLVAQFNAMSKLIGTNGIQDAADLDQLGERLHDFIDAEDKPAIKKLLEIKHRDLPVKDASDIKIITHEATTVKSRIHNDLTNNLREILRGFTLTEGVNDVCQYDVIVERYDPKGNNLLIEVKSTTECAVIRMAVGQLFHYSFTLDSKKEPHLAILLPERPSQDIESFLERMKIGLLWFVDNQLCTANKWLSSIAKRV